MSISYAERRQIENEMIFRRSNENVANALETLDAMHSEDGNFDLMKDEELEIHFKCECSDENCAVRIPMLLVEYQKIHADRNNFIVLPDHQVDPIEKVVKKTPGYNVVKKNNSIIEPTGTLNVTAINNI
ncbi:MAG: hypothetical protein V4611_01840 [Patescibacteria group bacterium]